MKAEAHRGEAAERLLLVDAGVTAFDRRDELLRLVGECATPDAASERLQADWRLTADQAAYVLALQIHRFSAASRQRLLDERAMLEAELDQPPR